MEDEAREVPTGWVRQYDPQNHHQFFVDTRQDPPRSIWHHPYDDEQYMSSLPSAERERIQAMTRHSSVHDIMAESSDDDTHHLPAAADDAQLPPREQKKSWGRKFKDKVTGSSHEHREAERKRRADEEQRAYEFHQAYRKAMVTAMETGQEQRIGQDRNGKDIFVQPPDAGGYADSRTGIYSRPNGTYIRPSAPYGRPYGYGYGGGYGLPLAGGLAGGLLLGDMMGGMGGYGMGGMGMGMGMGGMGMGGMGMGMGGW